MALGDIKGPDFDIAYRAIGTGSPVAGDIVAYDSSGNIILGSTTTMGKHGILSALSQTVGATTYYGVITAGKAVCKAGGAIKPNKFVVSDTNADAVQTDLTISATPTQAQIQALTRVLGKYLRLDGDSGSTYAATDAANTNLIIVNVGEQP